MYNLNGGGGTNKTVVSTNPYEEIVEGARTIKSEYDILKYYSQVTLKDNNLVYHVQPWMCVPGQLGYISFPILLDSNGNEISSDKWIRNLRYIFQENDLIDAIQYDIDTNRFVYRISPNTPLQNLSTIIDENQLYTISLTLNWESIDQQLSNETVVIDPNNSLIWNFKLYLYVLTNLEYIAHSFLHIIDQANNIYTIGATLGSRLPDGTIIYFDYQNDIASMVSKEACNIYFIVQDNDLNQTWMLIKSSEAGVLHTYNPIIPDTLEANKFYFEFDDILYTLDIPNFNYDNFYRVMFACIQEEYDPDDINWG